MLGCARLARICRSIRNPQDVLGVEAPADHLQGHVAPEGCIVAHSEVDLAHAAPANGADQPVGAYVLVGRVLGGLRVGGQVEVFEHGGQVLAVGVFEERLGCFAGPKHALELFAQLEVVGTTLIEEGAAFLGRLIEEGFDLLPAFGR